MNWRRGKKGRRGRHFKGKFQVGETGRSRLSLFPVPLLSLRGIARCVFTHLYLRGV